MEALTSFSPWLDGAFCSELRFGDAIQHDPFKRHRTATFRWALDVQRSRSKEVPVDLDQLARNYIAASAAIPCFVERAPGMKAIETPNDFQFIDRGKCDRVGLHGPRLSPANGVRQSGERQPFP